MSGVKHITDNMLDKMSKALESLMFPARHYEPVTPFYLYAQHPQSAAYFRWSDDLFPLIEEFASVSAITGKSICTHPPQLPGAMIFDVDGFVVVGYVTGMMGISWSGCSTGFSMLGSVSHPLDALHLEDRWGRDHAEPVR